MVPVVFPTAVRSNSRTSFPLFMAPLGFAWLFLSIATGLCAAQASAVPPEFIQATQAMREGRLNEAAAGFAAAVKRQPTFAEAHFNLGLVDEELGKYDEAVVCLREALKVK